MLDSVLSLVARKRISASTHASLSGALLACRAVRMACRWSLTGLPLPLDCLSTSPIVRGSSGVSTRYSASPMNKFRALSLKNASVPLPRLSVGYSTWAMASASPTTCRCVGRM